MSTIEESGTVIAVEGDSIVVQTQPRSACSSCNVGSDCGNSILSRWFGARRNQIRVRNHLGLRIGDNAVVGIHESLLLKASLFAYLMPMLAMIWAAIAALALDASDGESAACAMLGLAIGLLFLQRAGSANKRGAYQAELIRQSQNTLNVKLERGTSS